MRAIFSFLLGLSLAFPASALDKSPFLNIKETASALGFDSYYSLTPARTISVAILDQGFDGYDKEIGRTLPKNTIYHAGPLPTPPDLKIEHGRVMAQILSALVGNNGASESFLPTIHLYNAYGYTNFRAAVSDIIAQKIDIVLNSEVWEYGSNWDGQGFYNLEVTRATDAGIIWVNAAGNFGNRTYNSSIVTGDDDWVKLPDANNALSIRCEKKDGKKCAIRAVLSWNDFKDDVNSGTEKDLDFALTDDLLNVVQSAALKQSADPNESRPGYSKYPREIITAEINPGLYFLRVKNRSGNFKAKDSLRITVDGDSVSMPSHSSDESLLNPAENLQVITVGASDSDRSSTSARLHKPELLAPSSLLLSNKDEFRGTSNSAAFVASGLTILKSLDPKRNRAKLLQLVSQPTLTGAGHGIPIQVLGFTYTGPGCFSEITYPNLPKHMQDLLDRGGVLVQTSFGARIMVPFDPITLASDLYRRYANDMIVSSANGYAVYPRYAMVPPDSVEVFENPSDARLCPSSQRPSVGATFSLPHLD